MDPRVLVLSFLVPPPRRTASKDNSMKKLNEKVCSEIHYNSND
jgi:hypothetical protein